MPFRERMKRAFGRKDSTSSDGNDLGKSNSRKGSNVYRPGEIMPKAKYRQPVDKKHKEKLESFSFVENFRKKSVGSLYSPMGSRMPSRNSSVDQGRPAHPRRYPTGLGTSVLAENANESGNVANVGGSRHHSLSNKTSEHLENVAELENIRPPLVTVGTADDHEPFTEDDFHKALQRATTRQQATTLVV